MTDFWVTFTISEIGYNGKTRQQRYDALLNEINNLQDGKLRRWEQPTSFVIFRTEKNITEVASACKRAIAPPHDVVLIHDVGKKSARIVGKSDDHQTLEQYMTYVKKV